MSRCEFCGTTDDLLQFDGLVTPYHVCRTCYDTQEWTARNWREHLAAVEDRRSFEEDSESARLHDPHTRIL
jgi:hypothetical protein